MKTTMKPRTGFTFVCAFLIPMLAACGGGGGGGGGSSSSNIASLSHIDWAVNQTEARQAITGSAAPSQTATQGIAEIDTIADNANEVIAGNVIVSDLISPASRAPFSCLGLSCSASYFGVTFSIDGGSPPSPDFGYDAAEFQPVMTHNGVSFGQIRGTSNRGTDDQVEGLLYGGWMEYSAFAVEGYLYPSQARAELGVIQNYVFGNSTGNNPSDLPGTTGTWTGVVIGADYGLGPNIGNIIQGTATVGVDFTSPNVDVSFSNLVDLDNPSRSIPSMDWANIPLSNGGFAQGADGQNQIQGQFYGPNHEEVSGVFDRSQILGAFGAIRGTTQ